MCGWQKLARHMVIVHLLIEVVNGPDKNQAAIAPYVVRASAPE
jgi:hypothetical protein